MSHLKGQELVNHIAKLKTIIEKSKNEKKDKNDLKYFNAMKRRVALYNKTGKARASMILDVNHVKKKRN
jgi:hypothetical protein